MLLSTGLVVSTAQPAWAPGVPTQYVIQNITDWGGTGYVLDVANWATNDGARVQMWDWRTTGNYLNQRWYNRAHTSYGGQIINVYANKCLDESAPRNGATVYIYHCTGARNQDWQVHSGFLVNGQDGRCLDIKDYNRSRGAALQVWDCTSQWNQVFWFTV